MAVAGRTEFGGSRNFFPVCLHRNPSLPTRSIVNLGNSWIPQLGIHHTDAKPDWIPVSFGFLPFLACVAPLPPRIRAAIAIQKTARQSRQTTTTTSTTTTGSFTRKRRIVVHLQQSLVRQQRDRQRQTHTHTHTERERATQSVEPNEEGTGRKDPASFLFPLARQKIEGRDTKRQVEGRHTHTHPYTNTYRERERVSRTSTDRRSEATCGRNTMPPKRKRGDGGRSSSRR